MRLSKFYITPILLLCCLAVVSQTKRAAGQQLDFVSDATSGLLKPAVSVNVGASESGLLAELLVDLGDSVKSGQVIARLDDTSIRQQLLVARGEAASRGRLEQAEIEVRVQTQRLEIIHDLHAKNSATPLELNKAESDLMAAKARLKSERENLEVLRLQVNRLEKLLAAQIIRSPVDGTVTEIVKEVGEYVAANSPIIVNVESYEKLVAEFSLTDDDAKKLHRNDRIKIRLPGRQIVIGTVQYVSQISDPEAGWFDTRIIIDNQDGSIRNSRCTFIGPETRPSKLVKTDSRP